MRYYDGEGRDGWVCTIRSSAVSPMWEVWLFQREERGDGIRAHLTWGETGMELRPGPPNPEDVTLLAEPTFRIHRENLGMWEALQEALERFEVGSPAHERTDGAERELEATQAHLEDIRKIRAEEYHMLQECLPYMRSHPASQTTQIRELLEVVEKVQPESSEIGRRKRDAKERLLAALSRIIGSPMLGAQVEDHVEKELGEVRRIVQEIQDRIG